MMKINVTKKILAVTLTAAVMLPAVFSLPYVSASIDETGNSEVNFNLSELSSLSFLNKDFNAYRISSCETSDEAESANIEDVWTVSAQNRLAPDSSTAGTDFKNLSILTYNQKQYTDFEATITFQQSWNRFGIMFGTNLGKFAYTGSSASTVRSEGGVFVYVEAEGGRVASGAVTGGSGNHPNFNRNSERLSTFTDGSVSENVSAKKMHTLKITVSGGLLTIKVDDLPESEMTVTLAEEYKGGYVSLVSNGTVKSGSFGSLRIVEIDEETSDNDDEVSDNYSIDFTSLSGVSNLKSRFNSYYYKNVEREYTSSEGDISSQWMLAPTNRLTATSNSASSDYKNLSVLTYKSKSYKNFEATVSFQQSWSRFGIMFGTELGEFAYTGTKASDTSSKGGVLVYAEAEGGRVAIGAVTGGSQPSFYRNATRLSTFTENSVNECIKEKRMHTLTVRVLGNELTITVDDLPESSISIALSDDYNGGYVSLVTNVSNKSGGFGGFGIKLLDEPDDDEEDYSNIVFSELSSVAKLKHEYTAYQLNDSSAGSEAEEIPLAELWTIDGSGRLVRNIKTEGTDTQNLSVLTYSKREFAEFEAVMTYTQCYNRLGIMFGADKGRYVIDDTGGTRRTEGTIVYIEAEGTRTAIGDFTSGYTNSEKQMNRITDPKLDGFMDENNKPLIGKTHKLKLVVKGGKAFIFVDDMENYIMYLTMPEDYKGGYISLFSTATNNFGFESFSVSEEITTEITVGGYTENAETVSFNFDDLAMPTDFFDAYYLKTAESGTEKVNFSDYWTIGGNKIYRKSTKVNSSDVSDLALLTYSGRTYTDFIASVKYQKNGGRLMLMFGTDGKSYPVTDSKATSADNRGLAVYVENDFGAGGAVVLMGNLQTANEICRTRIKDLKVEGYHEAGNWNFNKNSWHTLQIWVSGGKCYIFIDEYGLMASYDLPEDYKGGYISLVSSQCGGSGFDDFTITDLSKIEKNQIVAYESVRDIKVKKGTEINNIGLPSNMIFTSLDGKKHSANVEWNCANYDSSKVGYYEFTGSVEKSGAFTNPGFLKCKIGVSVIDYDPEIVKKWEFDSADDLKDFRSFFLENTSESVESVETNDLEGWSVRDGLLTHKASAEGNDTNNLSILTYVGEKYENFEVNLSFKQYYTRCMLLFGSQEPGQYIFDDINLKTNSAVAAYVEFEGRRVAIGGLEYPDTNYMVREDFSLLKDYVKTIDGKTVYGAMHNLKVIVSGKTAEIYIDDADVPLKIYLSDNYKDGYISLVSTGKNDAFDSFSIKRLPKPGKNEAPNNAIEANGYLNLEKVERLEASVRPSVTENKNQPGEKIENDDKKSDRILYSVIASSVIVIALGSAVFIAYNRKKKKRTKK